MWCRWSGPLNLLYLVLGISLLFAGGEMLIRGALGAAQRIGISPLLSGLVIVGFGTSAPELVVSVNAVLEAQPEIAIGNVVGSNIGNILLILGICALIQPMQAHPLVLRRDALAVIVTSAAFVLLTLGGTLSRLEGLLMLAALLAFLVWAYRTESRRALPSADLHAAEAEELQARPQSAGLAALLILGGLAVLIGGSNLFLSGAVGIARAFDVSDAVIGLTLVAVGTSLPELSISMIAAIRGHADVAIGNVLGSNLFNLLGILGISAALTPLAVPARIMLFDQWVMLGSAVALAAFLISGRRLSRAEAAVLLAAYAVYVGASFLFIEA